MAARYTPSPGRAVAVSYRFTRQFANPNGEFSEIKQIDVAAQWPVNPQWTLLGRYNYSLVDSKVLEALAGVEYNGDCWSLRAVLHRLATTVDQTNTSFFIQLELNGLARRTEPARPAPAQPARLRVRQRPVVEAARPQRRPAARVLRTR